MSREDDGVVRGDDRVEVRERPAGEAWTAGRRAFWNTRPIHLHHEILDLATATASIDVDQLDHHLRTGVARADVFADLERSASPAVTTSPHVFLPDGTDHANPGISVHWHGNWAEGFPVVEHADPTIPTALIEQAAPARS